MFRPPRRFLHNIRAMAQGPANPLVVVIGATGTGKSKLAIDLAKRFDGEIINGDAMQLYAGLPVITNKVTEAEMQGIPHHLLGCIGLDEPTWTVGQFVPRALKIIEEIRERGKLPILVGGTHYYTQSLLFKDRLADEEQKDGNDNDEAGMQTWPILQEPTSVILDKLRQVDPVMADRWHPNDRRKIQRSLEIWLKTGKPASQVYEEQQTRKVLSADGAFTPDVDMKLELEPTLTFPTLLLWVHAESDTLRIRLDSRVDVMVDQGLLSEVASLSKFLQDMTLAGETVDCTRGIWVSIGFKEFKAYQTALSSSTAEEKNLLKLKDSAIEQTKAATRQYSKRQLRWIRIKLLHALREANAQHCIYVVDGSDLNKWQTSVTDPAYDIVEKFLQGQDLPKAQSIAPIADILLVPKREYDLSQRRDLWERRYCADCDMTAVTESDWNQHIKSRGHRLTVAGKRKREKGRLSSLTDGAEKQDTRERPHETQQ